MNEIIIYQIEDNQTRIEVRFEQDTVWLTQQQMASLFEQTKQNISLHINNCFNEGELYPDSVVKESLTTAADGKRYRTKYYNLDVIISVGYRVKSKRGTQFRQWATMRLKEYLVEGYSINQKRLEERNLELKHLKNGIAILRRAIEYQAQSLDDAEHLAGLIEQFSGGLLILDDYDHETLDVTGKTKRNAVIIEAADYRKVVDAMRSEFVSELFGKEKDTGFESSIRQIYQNFGGTEMYPSVEEKAAMLLYLIVKNHSFVDGNKRIAAACFLYFLERNGLLYHQSGETIISNEALASLTLFIAVSKPEEMQTVKQVAISLLNRKA
jgi:death-on-curing family protein